jgi:secretion/DNA translocation related TadE-like protein
MTRVREHGGVSVVMLAVLVIGLVLTTGAARLGGALVARARAETAADAAALAAADRLALGGSAAASRTAAAQTAASNDARLVSCRCAGTSAAVVVELDLPGWGGLLGPARGRARAEVRPECVVDLPGC